MRAGAAQVAGAELPGGTSLIKNKTKGCTSVAATSVQSKPRLAKNLPRTSASLTGTVNSNCKVPCRRSAAKLFMVIAGANKMSNQLPQVRLRSASGTLLVPQAWATLISA